MILALITAYFQGLITLGILFVAFNLLFYSRKALNFTKGEKLTLVTVPLANVLISLLFGGFFGSVLSILSFVLIYKHFTSKYPY